MRKYYVTVGLQGLDDTTYFYVSDFGIGWLFKHFYVRPTCTMGL